MSEKIIPMNSDRSPNQDETELAQPHSENALRPATHVIYRYVSRRSSNENGTLHVFDPELIEPSGVTAALTTAREWEPYAILKIPALVCDQHGSVRLVLADGTPCSANDLIERADETPVPGITLEPVS